MIDKRGSSNTFKDLNDSDFTLSYNKFYVVTVILVSLRIWFYDKKPKFVRLYGQLKSMLRCSKEQKQSCICVASTEDHFDYVGKTKSMIIDAGGSLAVGTLVFLLMLPAYFSKMAEMKNFQDVNQGKGRTLFYLSRISLPLFRYCSLPFVCYCASSMLRSSVMHKLKSMIRNS